MNKTLLWLLMLSCICEKIGWRVLGFRVSLFWLFGVLTVGLVVLNCKKQSIRIDATIKGVLTNRVFLLLYAMAQILVIPHSSLYAMQYFKGFVSMAVDIVILFCLLYCTGNLVKSKGFETFFHLFCGVCVVNTIYNLIQRIYPQIDNALISITDSAVVRYGLDPYGKLGRLTGMFTDSNNNGVFLVISVLMYAYAAVLWKNDHRKKQFYYFMIVLSLVMIILTFSLTAYLSLVVAVVYYLRVSYRMQSLKMLSWIVTGSICFLLIYYLYPPFREIITAKLAGVFESQKGNASHLVLLMYSVQIWTQNAVTFLFGTGINCMTPYFDSMFSLPGYKAHNYYLQNIAEYGIIGFVIVVAYLVFIWKKSKPRTTTSRNVRTPPIIWQFRAAFLVLLIANFFNDSMVQPFFIIFIAAIYAYRISVDSVYFPFQKSDESLLT